MLYPVLKRFFDMVMTGLGPVLLLPMRLLLGHVMKLLDGGFVSCTKVRIGWFGHPFRIHEFVSVVFDADKFGPSFTKESDPRTNWIGQPLFVS